MNKLWFYVKGVKFGNNREAFIRKPIGAIQFFSNIPLWDNDCLYRNLGVYKFAFFLDTDDFFIPYLSNKTMGYYINRVFADKNEAEVGFGWYQYYPDCGLTEPLASLKDGNVTRILAYKENWKSPNSKYACRPLLTTIADVHKTDEILGTRRHGNDKEAYVAHVRQKSLYNIPNKSKCKKMRN